MKSPTINNPLNILSSWLALEVLSPQTFAQPKDLANSMGSIADLAKGPLPWEGEGEKGKPDYKLYYQVVIGTVNFKDAITKLLEIYADKRPEKPSLKGEAILATVLVNAQGIPVGKPAIAISSFAWGVAKALKQSLTDLVNWELIEPALTTELDKRLQKEDEEGAPIPLSRETINEIRSYLIQELELPVAFYTNNCFAVRTYQYKTNMEPPEPLLLNSFFLGDLAEARTLFKNDKATPNLKKYLRASIPAHRIDILHDKKMLEAAVAPAMVPPARWPGPGRHPLVLLQQAAVNLIANELKVDGVMAVNGPPGTGKTTLLRDIVAGLVTRRAEAMCGFNDPMDAFIDSRQTVSTGTGNAFFRMYKLADAVKGFEILIASSNNKAVENVSAELPGLKAIADDADELRYFTALSDSLLQRESWGLIAAVLGNAGNISIFRNKFWWDKDVGISTYLMAITGNVNAEAQQPRIVVDANGPKDHEEALVRWRQAKDDFLRAKKEVTSQLERLEEVRKVVLRLSALEEAEDSAKQLLDKAIAAELESKDLLDMKINDEPGISGLLDELHAQELSHLKIRPGFWARLFRTISANEWKYKYEQIKSSIHREQRRLDDLNRLIDSLELSYQQAIAHRETCYKKHQHALGDLNAVKNEIETYRELLGSHLIDSNFYKLSHEEKHQISPWCNSGVQQLRDEVFIKAISLHKAFIDAAAKPIRHNLGILMNVFSGKKLTSNEQLSLLADLWSSLFIVIPCLSTTFASVRKMLGNLPNESLGWLLVDEAGQALPQAAVGAIMRTKRVVMVGDPVQIEPVVVLPELLTQSICKSFDVDPLLFNAPVASAQTLADAATPYFAEFEGNMGSRAVGIPLLVHRRCENPMFDVSNAIAYDGLMVKAKKAGKSAIRDCLGKSGWIDVKGGSAQDKWSYEEGVAVIKLLEKLKLKRIHPDLYIVTPFKVVADGLRRLIRESDILIDWVEDAENWPKERIGTVHTVQGREAEAVIFVLGAPQVVQQGARNWAGGRPNLVNVAVTRAKEVLYVIGNRVVWKEAGVFRELSDKLGG